MIRIIITIINNNSPQPPAPRDTERGTVKRNIAGVTLFNIARIMPQILTAIKAIEPVNTPTANPFPTLPLYILIPIAYIYL